MQVNTNSGPSPNKQVPVESSAFRSVKTQDLVKLRKLLEKGDIFEAQHLIWSNPRYLISSGDTPTVLQVRHHIIYQVASDCLSQRTH